MTGPSQSIHPMHPREINGVRLYRKDGRPRARFGEAERLQMLGGHERELDAFTKLFASRRKPYIVQRAGHDGVRRGWFTSQHLLARDDVAKHLLAGSLPGVKPVWFGTRAWQQTRVVAIDVDFRGEQEDFLQRCRFVEKTLMRFGVPQGSRLVQKTPSGGRHYYFFLKEPVSTFQLREHFEWVGLYHRKGEHEIYPSTEQGLRLPFGFVAGEVSDPNAWLRFIRRYLSGDFPRVNWRRCQKRALNCAHRAWSSTGDYRPATRMDHTKRAGIPRRFQCPTSFGNATRQRRTHDDIGTEEQRCSSLTEEQVQNAADIDALWKLGIQREGTRIAATMRIAWHFIFVKRLSEELVVSSITDWVYRTGERTSKDVKYDLRKGTRHVAREILQLVRWLATRREQEPPKPRTRFSHSQVDAICERVSDLPPKLHSSRLRFMVDLLNFAESHGEWHQEGLVCCPSIRGIVRQWKGCSGMRYKQHRDWAQRVGLVDIVREKRQTSNRTGRPQTWLIKVPQPIGHERILSYEAALEYGRQRIAHVEKLIRGRVSHVNKSDTYTLFTPQGGEKGNDSASDRTVESVVQGSDQEIARNNASHERKRRCKTRRPSRSAASSRENANGRNKKWSTRFTQRGHRVLASAEVPKRQHSQGSRRRLVKGTSKRLRQSVALSGLRDSAAVGEHALSGRRGADRCGGGPSSTRRGLANLDSSTSLPSFLFELLEPTQRSSNRATLSEPADAASRRCCGTVAIVLFGHPVQASLECHKQYAGCRRRTTLDGFPSLPLRQARGPPRVGLLRHKYGTPRAALIQQHLGNTEQNQKQTSFVTTGPLNNPTEFLTVKNNTMCISLKDFLYEAYGNVCHSTCRGGHRSGWISIDDFDGDAREHFCSVSVKVLDDDAIELELFNAPINNEVKQLLRSRDAVITGDSAPFIITVSLTAQDTAFVRELAKAIRGITRRGQKYENRNWKWVCRRTANSLDGFAHVQQQYRRQR